MAISVRPVVESDVDAVADLAAQLGYDIEPSLLKTRLSKIRMRPDHRFLVAQLDGRAIGWLHAKLSEYVETDPFVVIGGLVVDKGHRRRGVGRMLLEHAEAWAREQGCAIVRLWSSAGRVNAHRFYERLGYVNIKTQYSFAKALDPAARDELKKFVPRIAD